MSLYNMIFGENDKSDFLLKCLGLNRNDIPRYRDCFLSDGKIVVHTRTGGGNREDYEDENNELANHKNYIRDEDDDFDCTYANFYFSFPEEYRTDLEALEKKHKFYTPSEKWKILCGQLKK